MFRSTIIYAAKPRYMYATQKNQLRRLSKQEFNTLSALSRLSKNLYNVELYEARQYFFAQRKRLTYESNYHRSLVE